MIELSKDSIDLGIVIRDSEASLRFYRDTLGLEHVGDMAMPLTGNGVMHRLMCGTTLIKLVRYDEPPTARNPPGGGSGGIGLRYFTLWVRDLEGLVRRFEEAGDKVVIPFTEIRPGVRIAMIEDPDGNWMELVQNT